MSDSLDISDTLAAKSDQLNAADLAGPTAFTIARVTRSDGPEQPVHVYLQGQPAGRPWKPCKTVRRLLVALWGRDAAQWVGRRLELYCDPSVEWAGQPAGGIRVRSASHLDGPRTLTLQSGRGKRAMITVRPLDLPTPAALTELGVTWAALDAVTAAGRPVPSTLTEARQPQYLAWLRTPAGADILAAARAHLTASQPAPE